MKRSGNCNRGSKHNRFVHGMCGTLAYKSWTEMRARCLNPKNPNFKNWGGRGITICERWLVFKNFMEDMGERSLGMTLERVDNDAGYFPENCVWADRTAQSRNRRYTKLTMPLANDIRERRSNGETLVELSKFYGVCISSIHRITTGESWQ